jgi:hypothetical protein
VSVVAEVERPPFAGRLLGAESVAHLGTLAATAPGGGVHSGGAACSDYVDWYELR